MTLMPETLTVLNEPALLFRHGQQAADPRDGLSLFGPFDADDAAPPRSPAAIALGTPEGLALWRQWASAMNRPAGHPEPRRHVLWPPYPGFEAAFGCRWAERPVSEYSIDRDSLRLASRRRDGQERAFAVVGEYLQGFRQARKLDERIAVAVCVVPDEVWANCRPQSRVVHPVDSGLSSGERALRRAGQRSLFDEYDTEQYRLSPDFRRQLKARAMQFDVPLQIVRESSLRLSDEVPKGGRRLTPLSDRMWNLGTALYYKAGGKPWRLAGARDGVCYIGIAFRRAPEGDRTACCAAQMFLNSGDGFVFLGEYGPWYSPADRQFRLTRVAASRLLGGALRTYSQLGGKPLSEVFLHARSGISHEEFAGYREACPDDIKLVGVRVRSDRFGPRLFRTGKMPVLRGTFWRVSDRTGYLFAAGFKPRLRTYDGWEVPVPLRIDIQHGDADIAQVARDIFGLTKLNYNSCRLGESEPVTVGFSDAVGEILISNPTIQEADRRPNFKFYI